jgi:MFS family permease
MGMDMVQVNPVMDLLQADTAGGLATWALAAAFVALLAALCVMLLLRKSSDRARYILGVVVGIIGLYNMAFPVIALINGASLSQYVVSNMFVGAALIFLSAGSIFREYDMPFALIFLVLIGPGIFLMIGSWVGSIIPAGYLLVVSLAWLFVWVLLLAIFVHGYFKRPKTP